jgi:hypothetical protein
MFRWVWPLFPILLPVTGEKSKEVLLKNCPYRKMGLSTRLHSAKRAEETTETTRTVKCFESESVSMIEILDEDRQTFSVTIVTVR